MSREEAINSPIQGGASDIAMYAMSRLRTMGIVSTICVHDDLTFTTIVEQDRKRITQQIIKEMVNPAPDGILGDLPWVIVPLSVESSYGPSWGNQQEEGVFSSTDYPEYKRILDERYRKAM